MKRENMFFHLFGVFRSTREFFTYTETSPLPVKGCLFWPMLGTHRHWTVKVILPATPTVTRDIHLLWSSLRTRDTNTYCQAFSSGAITTCTFFFRLRSVAAEIGTPNRPLVWRMLYPAVSPPRLYLRTYIYYLYSNQTFSLWRSIYSG